MKKNTLTFICTALLVLAIVPAINLGLGNIHNTDKEKWWSRVVLYDIDFALPFWNRAFYPFGISTNPIQVVIGKNGWLYLGDMYEKTISVARYGATAGDMESARKIDLAAKAWDEWLKHRGVRLYQVMLGPNKDSIYPEFSPEWARPAANPAIDALLANDSQEIFVDARPALRAAKSQFSESLYYKTDSHWNNLGGWMAFRAFAKEVGRKEKELRWLSDRQVRISNIKDRNAGDIANFLRMKEMLRDREVAIEIVSGHPIETEVSDFDTKPPAVSANDPSVAAAQYPLLAKSLTKSKYALNRKKVLWLHDSFGGAITPFMLATFTETLQLGYDTMEPVLFAKVIDAYKPDYVFITMVERKAFGGWFFENIPPS